MKLDLDDLERKASAATQGEWTEHIAANSPPVTLALVAIAKALVAFERVQREIEHADAEGKIKPMSPESIELGGKSIEAWQRVEEALKAVMP